GLGQRHRLRPHLRRAAQEFRREGRAADRDQRLGQQPQRDQRDRVRERAGHEDAGRDRLRRRETQETRAPQRARALLEHGYGRVGAQRALPLPAGLALSPLQGAQARHRPRMSLAVGIEIGGTKLQAGVGLRDGKLVALVRRTVDPSKGGAGIREQIPGLIDEVIEKAGGSPKDLVGLGVGFGGPVDTKRGRILVSHQIEGWADFPLRDWLQKKVEVPVVLQNDAKTAALAEATLGAGQGKKRIFYITVGSGVGGGLVADGTPDVGQGLGAGEIGHTWVPDPDSGKPDKLEHVASGWSIGKRGSRRLGRELSGAEVASLAAKGDAT